jgi:AraC-type DNA-binding domain-containing proteins
LAKRVINYKLKIFASFSFLVLIIVLVLGAMYYINIRGAMSQQTIEASLGTIKLLKNSTEMMLSDADRSLMNISLDPSVESFAVWGYEENRDISEVLSFMRRISNGIVVNRYFNSSYVYYLEDGKVFDIIGGRMRDINTMTFRDGDSDETKKDKEVILNATKLYMDRSKYSQLQIYCIDTKYKKNILTLVKPVCITTIKPKALLIITLNQAYFDDMLKSINIYENSNVYIADNNERVISKRGKDLSELLQQSDKSFVNDLMKEQQGNSTLKIGGETYLISFVTSEYFGWKFIYTIPTKEVYKKIDFTVLYLIILSALCLLLGITISIIITGRLYIPIRKLLNSISPNIRTANNVVKDDITFIDQNIRLLVSQNRNLEDLLDESMPVLKNSMLQRILKNNPVMEEAIWDKLDFYKSVIKPDNLYAVCIIGIDDFESLMKVYSEKQLSMLQVYQSEMIANISLQMEGINAEIVNQDPNEFAVIVGISKSREDTSHTDLIDFINAVHKSVSADKKYTMSIGVGAVYDDIRKIYMSYKEARSALGYKAIKGNGRVIHINDIPKVSEWYFLYPSETEKMIFSCIKSGEKDREQKELDNYFKYAEMHIVDCMDIKYYFVHLLDATIRFCLELAINLNEIFSDKENLYKDLSAKESISEVRDWFRDFHSGIIDYINDIRENRSDEIVQKAIGYINTNYMLPDISLDLLAEQMHFSVSYLVRNFKDITGKTIKEYITEKRMEEAKRLLESTAMKVKDIGEKIGYPNTQSFINIFKKYQGETPGEYHERSICKSINHNVFNAND